MPDAAEQPCSVRHLWTVETASTEASLPASCLSTLLISYSSARVYSLLTTTKESSVLWLFRVKSRFLRDQMSRHAGRARCLPRPGCLGTRLPPQCLSCPDHLSFLGLWMEARALRRSTCAKPCTGLFVLLILEMGGLTFCQAVLDQDLPILCFLPLLG